MKRSRFLLATITAATLAGLAFTACEKTPEKSADKPATETPAKPGEPAKPAESSKAAAAAQPTAVPAAEVAKIAGAYGFVAKLSKDTEGFSASYRLHDLWVGLSNSKWAATLLDLPPVKENPNFARMREQWNSPQAEQIKMIAAEVLGHEAVMAMPAGFTSKLGPWMELLGVYYETLAQAWVTSLMSGGQPTPDQMQAMLRDAAPRFMPILAKCEVPPLLFAFKAAKVRAEIDDASKKLIEAVGSDLPPAFEAEKFKLGEVDFQAISVNAKKLIAQFQEEQIKLQMKELLGDEQKAKEALEAIVGKRVELAWGWVGDYLVVSLGTDHKHLKFATSETDSALAIPAVAARAAQFLDKQPMGLSYASKGIFEAVQGKLEFAETFKGYAEELAGTLKPEQIQAMVTDVKRLEGKAQELFMNSYEAMVQVDFWDAGLRSELFGGAKNKAFDSSKPLAFANLASPATFFLLNGRGNGAYSKAVTDFIEDGASTVWGWFDKYGRPMVPESNRQGFAAIEALALPMVKDFWKATRNLGKAFGDEAAILFDTAGVVPKIPDMPPFLAEGKMPRLAYVVELKDRAAVAEAWKGYSGLIKQLVALIPTDSGVVIPEPQSKQEGDLEIHFVPLPIPTDDLLPHIAISKDRWMLSTSPSLSKELAAKPANTSGPALGNQWTVNFGALYDHADAWLKVLDKNASEALPGGGAQYQQMRPLIEVGLKLARSLQSFEWKFFEEGGQTRNSFHLKLQDLK